METLATGLLIVGTVSFAKKLILYFALRVWLSVVAFGVREGSSPRSLNQCVNNIGDESIGRRGYLRWRKSLELSPHTNSQTQKRLL